MKKLKIRTSGREGQEGRSSSYSSNTLLPSLSGDILIYGPRRYRATEFHFHVTRETRQRGGPLALSYSENKTKVSTEAERRDEIRAMCSK